MIASNLRTNYLTEPMGLDTVNPRFYWNCQGGIRQTAYQISAVRDGEEIWNSGKVASKSMTHIRYEGKPLHSRDHVQWNVRLWDENDICGEAVAASFEMGLLEKADWKAQWITGDYKPKKNRRYPADCFKKSFTAGSAIRSARLYITALGVYEAFLNGQRVGDFVLAPGATDYRKRLQYQTYDVTALLGKQNILEITLGDGWYRGSLGAFGQTNVYGRQTAVISQLEITYEDGSSEMICSDTSFLWSNDGPVRFNDLKDGEIVDLGREPGYLGRAKVIRTERNLTGCVNVAVKKHETFTPTLLRSASGKAILDFGQNIAGFLAIRLQGEKGKTMKLTLAETLDADGELNLSCVQLPRPAKEWGMVTSIILAMARFDLLRCKTEPTPKQEYHLICSGGTDHYETRFAISGFRYAQVDWDGSIDPEDFKAIAVYSDLAQTGDFQCSNPLVNKLVENTRWSMKGNFADVPTDCPTRERLGWTGDAQIFFQTASYFMDVASFYGKYMQDMADGMMKSGVVSAVVPYCGMDIMYERSGSSVGWGDAAVLIPYRFYLQYGDREILERFYPMMSAYAEYMISQTGYKDKKKAGSCPENPYVYEKGVHYGEWLEPPEFRETGVSNTMSGHIEECTAYLSYTLSIMEKTAKLLNREKDAKRYGDYAEGARNAYHKLFFSNGIPDTDRQAKLVRPLAFRLVRDPDEKKAVEARLKKAAENRHYMVGTGFLSTPFLLPVLTDAGYAEDAYRILENTDSPGWLHEILAGATTIWEAWDGVEAASDGSSLNHYSPGAVCQWLFDTCAGIRVTGENHFLICPVPGGTFSYADAFYQSLYGKVTSRWEKEGENYCFHIKIPENTTAEIRLPDGTVKNVCAGSYQFRIA